ncbi:hypothetical protein ACOSQ3_033299 [Xanthoceras sorbifolium]
MTSRVGLFYLNAYFIFIFTFSFSSSPSSRHLLLFHTQPPPLSHFPHPPSRTLLFLPNTTVLLRSRHAAAATCCSSTVPTLCLSLKFEDPQTPKEIKFDCFFSCGHLHLLRNNLKFLVTRRCL